MTLLASLRGRIFLASALLAVLSIGAAIYVVNERVTSEAERALQREIRATGALVDELRKTRAETDAVMARLIADLPKLKAAVDTNDPATVQDIVSGYSEELKQLRSDLLVVTNAAGQALLTAGDSSLASRLVGGQTAVHDALAGRETLSLLPQPDGMLQLVTVPISIGLAQPQILGTLNMGFLLNDAFAKELKDITGSDIAFGMDGRILVSTMPRENDPMLAERLHSSDVSTVAFGSEEYVVLPRPLTAAGNSRGPVALILRSRTEQLRSLEAIHTGLAVTAVVAVLLATLLSFAVARTITRPLAAITDVMREVAATGDLTRKIELREAGRLDDEDARLLATTFNTLTDSVARFQREMSQKERLSSLGRLSTVIAHEVRNPLMIMKASLHTLRQREASASALSEAVADVDEEVERLNRIVNEVLDFARPIRFELVQTDVNALCRESAVASQAGGSGTAVHLDLDPTAGTLKTDPERLRIALVNILVNARHAVNGVPQLAEPPVTLITRANGDRVSIIVADRGAGIEPAHLPHVFDPYFTTKRGGTGLGLAIAKNIIEGLGGAISITSAAGVGTRMRIDLPLDPRSEQPPRPRSG